MTKSEIQQRVQEIRGLAVDPEVATDAESKLFIDVLSSIALTDSTEGLLAREALLSLDIEFPRWSS